MLLNHAAACWYTPTELAKRMAFYHSCQYVGSMMSGALQVGNSEHTGWKARAGRLAVTELETCKLPVADPLANLLDYIRWLFVINAIMTVVVGFAGFVMLPDYPNQPNPRAFWFKHEHSQMACERLERHGRAGARKITWSGAKYVGYHTLPCSFIEA